MSEGGNGEKKITFPLPIPIIRAESETQTLGHLVSRSPDQIQKPEIMEPEAQKQSLRKRRNLSKNRGQATRQREKTPEPGRTPIHEDTTTSDDDDNLPQRNSREIEADSTYEEMKRLVQEQAGAKDPVYDIDTDEIMEQRTLAAHERRRRSVSPFALPDKEREELYQLERKMSFTDPNNKLLSSNYSLNPKEDELDRRSSLTIESPKDRRSSLTPPTPTSASSIDNMPFPLPTTPKKLEEMVYPDEVKDKSKTPVTKANVFTFDDKDTKLVPKTASSSDIFAKSTASKTTETQTKPCKAPESAASVPGELVTKVIQVERTSSKKLSQENKPVVEIRERIVRTPSRKMSADAKPTVIKQQPKPVVKEEPQSKVPPVKPARSKSATRFGVSFYVKLILILFVALFIAMYFQLAQ